LEVFTELTTSRIARLRARRASGSTFTRIWRTRPPPTAALATPGRRSICGSIVFKAMSYSCRSSSPSAFTVTVATGMLLMSNLMMNGCWIPGGSWFITCETRCWTSNCALSRLVP